MRYETWGKIDSYFCHYNRGHKTKNYVSITHSLKMREQLSLVLCEDLSDAFSFFMILP